MLVKVTLEHGGKGVDGRVINGQVGGAVYWSTLLWRVLIQKKIQSGVIFERKRYQKKKNREILSNKPLRQR